MSDRYVQNKEIIQSKIGDEVVMLDIESGYYFGLNSIASDIWHHLKEEISFNDLLLKLMESYNVEIHICENDTKSLLSEMLAKNIIRKV